jgi:hypothetical protein
VGSFRRKAKKRPALPFKEVGEASPEEREDRRQWGMEIGGRRFGKGEEEK